MSPASSPSACDSASARPRRRRFELRRLGGDALGDLAAAFAERLGGVDRAARQALVDRFRARRQHPVDALEDLFERAAHLVELVGGAGVGRLDAGIEARRRFLAAPGEPLVELAAAHDDGLLDRRQRRFELGGEQLRLGLDARDDVAAALGQRRLDVDHAVAQQIVDGAGVGRQRQLDHRLVGGGRRLELGQPRGARFLQPLTVIAEGLVEAVAVLGEALVEAVAMFFEAVVEMRLVLVEALVELALAAAHHRVDRTRYGSTAFRRAARCGRRCARSRFRRSRRPAH